MIHLKDNIFAISVPEDADRFAYDNRRQHIGADLDNGDWFSDILPEGNWEVVGTVTNDRFDFDITDVFNCPELNHLLHSDIKQYFKQHHDKLLSLFLSKGVVFENPIEVITKKDYPDWSEEKETRSRQAWQEAEQNLVHKLLILKNYYE